MPSVVTGPLKKGLSLVVPYEVLSVPAPPLHLVSVPPLDTGTLALVALSLLIELAVIARGLYTRERTHVVLAAVAVNCLLVSLWDVVTGLSSPAGVYWSGLATVFAGGILTFLVVMDILVKAVLVARETV